MTAAPPSPTDTFMALWPRISRYAGRMAARSSKWSGVDREDLFAAGMAWLWKAVRKGTFDGHPEPFGLAVVIAKRGMIGHLKQQRRFGRVIAFGAYRDGGDEDDGEGASVIDSLPAPDGYADPPLIGFEELVAHARPCDQELLTRRFRDGEGMEAIAARLGVSRQYVSQRLAAALARIRKRVGTGDKPCNAVHEPIGSLDAQGTGTTSPTYA